MATGTWWCDADRLETYTTHLAMAVLLPVAFTVGRPPKLGFVKDSDDDLIDVGENEDEKAWMPFRDVVYLAGHSSGPSAHPSPDSCRFCQRTR